MELFIALGYRGENSVVTCNLTAGVDGMQILTHFRDAKDTE